MNHTKKFLTVQNAALELGVSDRHIYNLIEAGKLEAYDISVSGRAVPQSLRVSVSSLESFRESRRLKAQLFP